MKPILLAAIAVMVLAAPAMAGPAQAQPAAQQRIADDRTPLSLEDARTQYRGEHAVIVLDFLEEMESVVNRPKNPAITPADWERLGQFIDRDRFRRVGNFGVRNDWNSYAELLSQWANSSWWKGYIWRLREVPAADGRPALVYLESEERSNGQHPVREDSDYQTLASIAVYEFGPDNKITALHVYDQMAK